MHIITLEKYFKKYEEINLEDNELKMLLNGVKLNTNKEDGIYRIKNNLKQIKIYMFVKIEFSFFSQFKYPVDII